ncbi:spermidine synthase, partial [Micrococcus luteus]
AVVAAFEHVEVIADPPMLKGRRRGNVIVAASDAPVARPAADAPPGSDPRDRLARALRMDAFPARLAEDPRGFPAGVAPGITGLVPGPEA